MICNEIQNTIGSKYLLSLTYEDYCKIRPGATFYEYMNIRRLAELGKDGQTRQITYKYGKLSNSGRVYSADKSIQSIPKEIRRILLPLKSREVDISNCHPCIFQHLCDKYDIECKGNLNYINNRASILKEANIDKNEFLTLFNCDKPRLTYTDVDGIIKDIRLAKVEIVKKFKDEYKRFIIDYNKLKKKYKSSPNPISSFIWHKITMIENIILDKAIKLTCSSSDYVIPLYDGFITTVDIDLQLLNASINQYTYIKFSIKDCELVELENKDYPYYDAPLEVEPIEELYKQTKDIVKINISCDGKILYFYDEVSTLWNCYSCKSNYMIFLRNMVLDFYIPILRVNQTFYHETDDEFIKITKEIDSIKKSMTSRDNIAGNFLDYMVKFVKKENIEFDSKIHLLHFKNNQCLNLMTMKIEPRCREDYCTYTATTLQKRIDCTENIVKLQAVIDTIFPDKSTQEDYFRCVINSFSGRVLEKFFLLNGTGANGKGVISGLLEKLLGNYSYVGIASIFNSPLEMGANPQIASMNGKRFCIFREADESKPLIFSTIKTVTGDAAINARQLYSTNCDCHMAGIKMLEVNKQPCFKGDTGNSMLRRQVNIEFTQEFSDNPTGNQQQGNSMYKLAEWNELNTSPLFYILYDFMLENKLDYYNMDNLILSSKTVNNTIEFIQDNDNDRELLNLIESYIIVDLNTHINIRDLHKRIRSINNISFKELWQFIKKNPNYKSFYRDRFAKTTNVLTGYRLKCDNEDEDNEDEDIEDI